MGSLDSPGLTIRAAEASEADAAVFARLLDQAQGVGTAWRWDRLRGG